MRTALFTLLASLGALVFIAPILWAVSTSLKRTDQTFTLPPQWIPLDPQWSNYAVAFATYPFGRFIFNSLVVAVAVTLVPTYILVRQLNWLDTYQGLVAPLLVDAFGVFLMRQFILSLTTELIEAARLDGASELRIYSRIVLPNIKPALAALAVFSFRESWDQFVWPLVAVTRTDMKTLPLGIAQFQTDQGVHYELQMAIAVVGMLPLVVLFIAMQRAFVSGITLTGLKG